MTFPPTDSVGSGPVQRVVADRPARLVVSLAFGLLAAAAVMLVALPDPTSPTVDVGWAMLVLIIVAYATCEFTVFNVVFRDNGISFSLSEIPFTLALIFLAPAVAVPARLVATLPVLIWKRGNRGVKLIFNVSSLIFEVALGFAIVRWAIGWWGDSSTTLIAIAGATTVVTAVTTSILISLAIASYEGDPWGRIRVELKGTWWLYPITSVAGAMTLALALIEPALALLAVLPATGAWYVLHRFGVLNQTVRNLHTLHGFMGRIGRSLDVNEICELAVDELRSDFRASGVALVRFSEHGTDLHLRGNVPIADPAAIDEASWVGPTTGALPVLMQAEDLERRGVAMAPAADPVYLCPLAEAGSTFGLIFVFVPPVLVGEQVDSDLARLSVLAEQLSVSLRRGMLHERLEYEARHDALTGLPARTLFEREVTEALAARTSETVAVMMLDLDRFKEVNDTLGHHAGDELLVEFSRRMSEQLLGGDVLARLAGDEFAILCRRRDPDSVLELARSCVDTGGRPVVLDGLEIVVTVSVGVALANPGEADPLQPMRRADIAMYNAKWQRTGVEVYRDEIDRRTPARLSMLGDLRTAIERNEMTVVYQPKLDLRTHEIIGVEALARWTSSTRGVVAPAEFVRVAEDTGLIKQLTDLVLDHGVAALRRFNECGLVLQLAINLSTHDLFDTRLHDRVMHRLDREGVRPSDITLEITESSLLVDAPRTRATIDDLHRAGLRLAVDDFGTGYSSLSYLRRLPVQELKIDHSFVSGMLADPQDEVIVRSTIDLGHNLELAVVAEGVEDDATLAALGAMGCDVAQGYGIARPLVADDLIAWVTAVRQEEATRVAIPVPQPRT